MASGLVDQYGRPISSVQLKKEAPPKLGNAFAPWAGRDLEYTMPGGSLVQFDLSKLRLEDYRIMRDHYQVNASLAVLSFMQHQADWHVECDDKKIADDCTRQLNEIWTQLNRSMGAANWAGFAPSALDWENNSISGKVEITKVKDLIPEECEVHWKEEEGWAPAGRPKPKYKVYDGINYAPQRGWPIPVENSFWYPLLMENGDYYGRKLLRPAFQSWYFSILVHLFANRYFERFGEPVPVGRAPFDEDLNVRTANGTGTMNSQDYMLRVLQDLRNRSVVVLPNDRIQVGNNGQMAFEYEMEYLESQMRGADFERYLTRLDEEISIGLFTPILLLRTADVGSYNLGVGHMQVYLWMLNAMNDDRALFINKYILNKYVNYNYSIKAPRAKIVFRKMGNTDNDLLKQVLVQLISNGGTKVDLDELGQLVGLKLSQIRQLTQDPAPAADPATEDPATDDQAGTADNQSGGNLPNTRAVLKEIVNRVRPQVQKAYSENRYGPEFKVNMGFKNKFANRLESEGIIDGVEMTQRFYTRMDGWVEDVTSLGREVFSGPDAFMEAFAAALNSHFDGVTTRAGANR